MQKANLIKGFVLSVALSSAACSMPGNYYAGLGIGQTSTEYHLGRELKIGGRDFSHLGKNVPSYSIFGGYNYLLQDTPLLIGVEAGLHHHNAEVVKQENNMRTIKHYTTRIETNNSLTAAFRFGIVIKDLLVYSKIGIARTNFKMKFVNSSLAPDDEYESTDKKFTKTGTFWGAGLDYKVNESWMIGADYTATRYPNIKLAHNVGIFKGTPSFHTTMFRLSYLF